MAYTEPSFKTKHALKDAIKAGKTVHVVSPNNVWPVVREGKTSIEGPSYQPHTWYAQVEVRDGKVVKVIS